MHTPHRTMISNQTKPYTNKNMLVTFKLKRCHIQLNKEIIKIGVCKILNYLFMFIKFNETN